MKITKKLAIILAIVSFGFAVASLAFMDWKEMDMNYEFHNQYKLYSFLFAALMIVFFIIAVTKKNKGVILPLLGFVPTGIYFVKKLYDAIVVNESVIDIISPADSNSVLTLLLFIAFITCAILSVIKENKFTKFYVVGYFALLILTTLKFLPEITMNKDLMPITFVAYSMVFGYAALMVFYIPTCCKACEEKVETTETKAEETAEAKVEETTEDTTKEVTE